jgi:surface carbohydrate biosynthesis protein
MRQFDKSALLAAFDAILAEKTAAETRSPVSFAMIEKPKRLVHPILYLPVEVKARELAAKALVARHALAAGFNVVIGSARPLMDWYNALPPGIVLFKTMNAMDAHNMVQWARQGHLIAALDDEMFGTVPTPDFIAATVHPYAPAVADLVCAQGMSYARAFPYPVPVCVTGNPRVATYPKLESRGDDIVVCLFSGNINNHGRSFADMVSKTLEIGQSLTSDQGQAWARILRESIAGECDMLPLVTGTVTALSAAFPDRRIIVRPHPVEDPAMWRFNLPNVTVRGTGSIMECLATAAVMVFVSGCTTGLDAYLAGVPAVRLGRGGHGVSRDMHVEANTPAEAVAAVRAAARWQGSIADHLAPVDVVGPLVDLYRANAAGGSVQLNPPAGFAPTDFRRRKFPDTTAAEISQLLGRPVRAIGWNTFFCAPVSGG